MTRVHAHTYLALTACLVLFACADPEEESKIRFDDPDQREDMRPDTRDTSVDMAKVDMTSMPDMPEGEDMPEGQGCQGTAQQAQAFISAHHERLCDKLLACGGQPELVQDFFLRFGLTQTQECVEVISGLRGSAAQHAQAVTDGRATFCPEQADTCLQQLLPNIECGDVARLLATSIERYEPLDACHDAFQGSILEDQGCTLDAECGLGLGCSRDYDAQTMGPCAGTCRPERTQLLGTCDPAFCAADQYCGDTANGICFQRKNDGESCSDDEECFTTSTCEGGTCTARITGVAVGQPCGPTQFCAAGSFCNRAMGTDMGTCQQAAGVGEACQFTGCVAGAVCTPAGTCDALLDAGQDCVVDAQCRSLRCAQGTCTNGDALCP